MKIASAINVPSALSALLIGTSAIALAHAPSFAAEPEEQFTGLEEIVVTSRKREERLQDVPAAITAFSGVGIEDAGIESIDDVTLLVPNLSIANTQNMGTAFINIRGVGQYRNSEPPIAMVIDGVQVTSPNQITQELFDIERIEVLKGPQGSLYGRNASGGAINIVTRQPTNEFEGLVRGTYGKGDDFRAQAVLSGPIVEDKVLFRAAGSYRNYDGQLTNEFLNEKVDFFEEKNFRFKLLAMPTDRLTLDLRASYSDADGGAAWFVPLPDGEPNNFDAPIQADTLGTGKRELQEYALKVDYDLDFATLTSVTSYSSIEEFFFEDLEWLSAPILTADQDLDTETVSQELRLTSNSEGRLRWMAGVYYLDTKRDLVTFVDLVGIARLPIGNLRDDNRAWAVFGNASYDITDSLELSLGLRYDEDRRKQTDFILGGAVSKATFDELQPKITLSWQATDEVLAYASYGSGFRSGGFNATATFGRQYDAEVVTSGEVGFKSTLMDGILTLNGAAFYSDFDNLQQYVLDVNSGGQAIVTVPNAEVYGLELEMQARPTADLQLFASLGLQDSKIQSELVGFDPAAVGYPAGFSFVGKKVPLVYKWSYALGAQYRIPLSDDLSLTLRGDYSGRGGNYWEANNLDKQNPVHIVNARATFAYENLEFVVWAENLFGEDYFEEFVSREFAGTIQDVGFPGRPRQYGVTATVRF
jgi:iron complex outermembrane receptor protein